MDSIIVRWGGGAIPLFALAYLGAPHKAKGRGVVRPEGPEPPCRTFCRIYMHTVINSDMDLNNHDAALASATCEDSSP